MFRKKWTKRMSMDLTKPLIQQIFGSLFHKIGGVIIYGHMHVHAQMQKGKYVCSIKELEQKQKTGSFNILKFYLG